MRLLTIATLTLLLFGCSPSQSEFKQLEAQGDSLIQQIEQHKLDYGTYPSDLEQAGIALPQADYGGWQYVVGDEGEGFYLSIGDYGEHYFTLAWTGQSWYRDT